MTTIHHKGQCFKVSLELKDNIGALKFKSGAVILTRRYDSTYETVGLIESQHIRKQIPKRPKLLAPPFIFSQLKQAEALSSSRTSSPTPDTTQADDAHSSAPSSPVSEYDRDFGEYGEPPCASALSRRRKPRTTWTPLGCPVDQAGFVLSTRTCSYRWI